MTRILQFVALLAILGTILPSLGLFVGWMDLATVKTCVLIATIVWFISVPLSQSRLSTRDSSGRGGVV